MYKLKEMIKSVSVNMEYVNVVAAIHDGIIASTHTYTRTQVGWTNTGAQSHECPSFCGNVYPQTSEDDMTGIGVCVCVCDSKHNYISAREYTHSSLVTHIQPFI